MQFKLKPLVVLLLTGLTCSGAGLVNPSITPPGGGNGGGPTNGQSAAQVATQIRQSNDVVFANSYIAQQSGTGTGTSLVNPLFQDLGKGYFSINSDHTIHALGNTAGPLMNDGTGGGGFIALPVINLVNSTNLKSSGLSTNGSSTGQVLGNVGSGIVGWTNNGAGSSIPSVLGVVTNTVGGVVGVTTAMPGTWLLAGSLPATAADPSWPNKTNYYNVTNATAGNAVVVVGPDANNNFWLKGTNWPSGGGSQTPWAQNIDAAKFQLYGLNSVWITNGTPASGVLFNHPSINNEGAAAIELTGTTNNIGSLAGFGADFLYAQSAVYINNGALHLNTNGVDVITLNTNAATFTVPVTINVGSSNYMGGTSIITNIWTSTNTAPTSVTIGVTVPDKWVEVRDLIGNLYKMPVWTNH